MDFPKQHSASQALFDELCPDDRGVARRPMFGHTAAFANGNMFMGTFGEDVILRLDEAARAELLRQRGTSIFEPMKGRPMREYVVVPRGWRDDLDAARPWVARSLAWVKSLPAKKPKGAAKPKARKPAKRR
ncbi:MAG TPA: TfoX/Sxy family protein [Haliangiales bacterium]|nr:TfoX/Sxy family protein [Haliangiales bacterium]